MGRAHSKHIAILLVDRSGESVESEPLRCIRLSRDLDIVMPDQLMARSPYEVGRLLSLLYRKLLCTKFRVYSANKKAQCRLGKRPFASGRAPDQRITARVNARVTVRENAKAAVSSVRVIARATAKVT